jgi:chromobox protein 1
MSSKKGKIKIKKEPKEQQQTEDIYTVEKIMRKRIVRGKVEYLVKWEGYSIDQNTWEPVKNILDPQVIADFEELQKPSEKKTTNRRSSSGKGSSVQSGEERVDCFVYFVVATKISNF